MEVHFSRSRTMKTHFDRTTTAQRNISGGLEEAIDLSQFFSSRRLNMNTNVSFGWYNMFVIQHKCMKIIHIWFAVMFHVQSREYLVNTHDVVFRYDFTPGLA